MGRRGRGGCFEAEEGLEVVAGSGEVGGLEEEGSMAEMLESRFTGRVTL